MDTHTAPVGHNYVDGICDRCGEAQIQELQDFYLIGYINGANYGCDEDWENLGIYKFVDGKLVAHFKQDSYVFVKTGDNGSWFMTEGFGNTEIPYAELFNTNIGLTDANKLFVPGGMKITFVLVRTGEDTFILGYTTSECEHPEHTITGKCVYCGEIQEHSFEITVNDYSCTVDGGVTHTCTVCGHSYTTDTVPASGHAFVEGAYTVNTCKHCGNTFNVYFNADMDWTMEKPVDIHDNLLQTKPMYSYRDFETTVSDVDTLEGWELIGSELIDEELGIYQYTFGRWTEWTEWTDEEAVESETREVRTATAFRNIDAVICDHVYEAVVTEPTCTEMGYTTYTCSVCGETYVTEYTDALGHSYEAVVTAPTCTAQGYTTHTCSRCSDSYKDSYTNPSGHSYTSAVTKTPTCTANGVRTYTCSKCSHSYTEAIAKLGHDYAATVTAPTCTEQGYTTHTCTRCSDSYKDSYTNPSGHNYTSKVTTAATCTTDGVRTYICGKCNHSYTEAIPATGHSYVSGKCACGDTKTVSINGSFNGWAGQNMTWTESGYTISMELTAGTYQFKLIKDGVWLGNDGDIWDTTTATSEIGWEFANWAGNCDLVATGGIYYFTFNFNTNFLVITYDHTHVYTAGEVIAPTCTAKGYTVYT